MKDIYILITFSGEKVEGYPLSHSKRHRDNLSTRMSAFISSLFFYANAKKSLKAHSQESANDLRNLESLSIQGGW